MRWRIGLAVERQSGFARKLLHGLAVAAADMEHQGVSLDIRFLFEGRERRIRQFNGYDGYIAQVGDRRMERCLAATGKPVVDVLVKRRRAGFVSVNCDHAAASKAAADHFIVRRFRSFAFCGIPGTWYSDERERHFAAVLAERGYPCLRYRGAKGSPKDRFDLDEESIEEPADMFRLRRFLRSLPQGTGVFCCNDNRAYQLMGVCRKMGRSVPGDIAVLGADDDEVICNFTTPCLSSIESGGEACGRAAASAMLSLLAKDGHVVPGMLLTVPHGEIASRESTDVWHFASPWLGEALRFIRINISRNITAAEVCSAVGMSHAAVGAAFRRELGRSVQDEIKAVRMEESERLLRSTTLSVSEVAMRSGFGSTSYFCSLFRFAHGVSPVQWRENATSFR